MTTEAVAARTKLLRQELARFIEIVTQQMQPERIILFGSFAVGQVSEWSDLDLVVSVQPQVGMDVLVYTSAEWAEMSRQRSFTQEEILNKGQVGYARAG
jgi:predicted nucleotidyltransferase